MEGDIFQHQRNTLNTPFTCKAMWTDGIKHAFVRYCADTERISDGMADSVADTLHKGAPVLSTRLFRFCCYVPNMVAEYLGRVIGHKYSSTTFSAFPFHFQAMSGLYQLGVHSKWHDEYCSLLSS